MEPPVATVQIKGNSAEVWTSVQNPAAAKGAVAARLKLEPANVKVNVLLLGGGFGRKSKPDFVDEAAIVARALHARHVSLLILWPASMIAVTAASFVIAYLMHVLIEKPSLRIREALSA